MRALGYYGFLATHVPPGRLLAAAARRASRRALNLVIPPLSPSRERLLEALGCDRPTTLAQLLGRPRPCPPPWDPASLREALERLGRGETERAIARAEGAAAGRARLFGRTFDVARAGGGTDWQLDALHGGRFAAWAPSRALPEAPGLDPRAAWELGRGEQWVALAQGAVLDARRGPAFAEALAASVHDFVAENPIGRGIHWACTMEAALRAWNLLVALWILAGARARLDPELAVDAAGLLVATGRFVVANLEDDTAVPNGALAADWLGLLACADGLPEWPESRRWRAMALEGLAGALREQVNDDGTSFEGSLPHQRFALEIFSAGALLAHAARRGVGREYARRLAGLFASTRALLASSGEIPQIGDGDAGRVFALRERGPAEGGWLLLLGAALLRTPSLLARPGPGDAVEVAWLLGPRAVSWLASARPGPRPRSASFPAGGFHVLRRGPYEAFLSCGPNGQRGVGGHSHNDKLALELFVGGDLAVCDGGTPTTADPEMRDAFRSTRAHATAVVDGLEQAPLLPDRLLALPDAASARLLAFEPGGRVDRIAGEHRGFARAGVIHRRELLVCEAGLAVVDRLDGAGAHRVELRWPFPSATARPRPLSPAEAGLFQRIAREARLRASIDASRAVEVPLGARRMIVAFAPPPGDLTLDVVPALRSPGYGQLCGCCAALFAGVVLCPAAWATLFALAPE